MKTQREQSARAPGRGLDFRLSMWALAFGCCIGWGCFIMPGTVFLPYAGPAGTAIAMALGAAAMVLIAVNYHVLILRFPDNGGAFAFTKRLFGYDHGFLCGWYLWLSYAALLWANAAAFILILRQALGNALAFGFLYRVAGYDVYFGEVLAAVGILLLFGVASMYAGGLQRVLHTVLALGLLGGVAACFLLALAKGGADNPVPAFSAARVPGVGIL
ncbi:MAG: APC family permease, partial [Oscillospiraceae bacterium]|nr:APC family permease [Oscillospiraceae bacterium]